MLVVAPAIKVMNRKHTTLFVMFTNFRAYCLVVLLVAVKRLVAYRCYSESHK
jgi:hypothetical protein